MRKALRWILGAIVIVAILAASYGTWLVKTQGLSRSFWSEFNAAQVRFDGGGIPTIAAGDWGSLIYAQGYVVASERLWQMDLIRRKASGRLSEFFGVRAFEHDARVASEDRLAIARRAHVLLPEEERFFCESYARGVNQFIQDHPHKWGVEYELLSEKPEVWTCADSLLVLVEMTETLTGFADGEAKREAWRRHLSPAWQAFLFSNDHPWNKPYFGQPSRSATDLPPSSEHMAREPLKHDVKDARVTFSDPPVIGSNNWAWRGKTGTYLANDPHLGNGVPGIWMANRLRVSADEWVVGVAIPGMPGIVIGMNPALAWAFTNTGEDIDDFLLEEVNDDHSAYVASRDDTGAKWRNVERKTFAVKVRGEAEPRQVEGLFTHRGPLSQRQYLGDGWYSRQWLALKGGMLRLPTMSLPRAHDVSSLMTALDGMRIPSQNVVFADGAGNIGYRVSGTGVKRRSDVAGHRPVNAVEGEWLGLEPTAERRKLIINANDGATRFLATANERIWAGPEEGWSHEDRKERIVRYLSSRDDFARRDMELLHSDVQGRFRSELLKWVAAHGREAKGGTKLDELFARWEKWDGSSRSDPVAFAQSTLVERSLMAVLLERVKEKFFDGKDLDVDYQWSLRRAWLISVLMNPEGFSPFGLEAKEVAEHLALVAGEKVSETKPHQETNRWGGQHPFANAIPVLGRLFAVEEYPQYGASDLVAAEGPHHGPSVRLAWDLTRPWESTWGFPVGQSGHIGSPHYRDQQASWFAGTPTPVFNADFEWKFVGRAR